MITTHNLSIGYGKKIIQSNLNLSTKKDQLICLIGTNGAGKSTLIRTLAQLQPQLKGDIHINDQPISNLSVYQRSLLISLVLTDKIENQNLTVFDLVAMGRTPYLNWVGKLSNEDTEKVFEALHHVNMYEKKTHYLSQCSDGEKQRAVIAMTLAQDTPIVLLDEPTAHLDLPNRIEIMLLLRRLSINTHKTFILSTHELDLAIQLADTIWLMTESGVEIGIPEDLMLNQRFTKAFGSDKFSFDTNTGHCNVKHPNNNKEVSLKGLKNVLYHWLYKALVRLGYSISDNAKIKIDVHCDYYYYNNQEYYSIKELLEKL